VVGESFLVLQRKENSGTTNPNISDDSSNVNFDDLGKKTDYRFKQYIVINFNPDSLSGFLLLKFVL